MKIYDAIYHGLRMLESSKGDSIRERGEKLLETIESEYLPNGSGFDTGCTIKGDTTTNQSYEVAFEYHHMSGYGFYTGWTSWRITVFPAFCFGFEMELENNDMLTYQDELLLKEENQEYFLDTFQECLNQEYIERGE